MAANLTFGIGTHAGFGKSALCRGKTGRRIKSVIVTREIWSRFPTMTRIRLLASFALLGVSPAMAQSSFPANPTVPRGKFKTRALGGGVDPGASIAPGKTEPPKVRHVIHIILHEYRMWSDTEGKPLEAKLLAFGDLVVEAPTGSAEPVMPAPPPHPTVTRDGKVRLLVNQKPVEIALDRLCQADREFIDQIKTALAKKAAARR